MTNPSVSATGAKDDLQPNFHLRVTQLTPEAFTRVADAPALGAKAAPGRPIGAGKLDARLDMTPLPAVDVVTPGKLQWQQNPAKLDVLRWSDAKFDIQLNKMEWRPSGIPRDKVTVPICPTVEVSDQVLFEDDAEPAKKFYLPRYRLAEHVVAGRQQYRIILEAVPTQGWNLTLHLEKFPAAEIEVASRMASVLPHDLAVLFRFNVDSAAGLAKELVFGEATTEASGVRATLHVNSLGERDQLYAALTSPGAASSLVVRRVVKVAIPVPQIERLLPDLVFKPPLDVFDPDGPIRPPRPSLPPKPQPTGPLFRPVTRVLDNPVAPAPFSFSATLHSYVFQNITPGTGQNLGLKRCQVNARIYYQDLAQPHVFFYLPDSFKIGRDTGERHRPLLRVSFTSSDGKRENTQATIEFMALPYLKPERFQEDANLLRPLIDRFPPGIDRPVFQPLLVDAGKIVFRLALPPGAGGPGLQDRTAAGAQVNLATGLSDSLKLSLTDFQTIYDALFGASLTLFTGQVEVSLGDQPDQKVPPIPFTARMDDLLGDVFDRPGAKDDPSGGVAVTLRNGSESTLSITSLAAALRRGDSQVPGRIDGLNLGAPIQLKPTEHLSFVVAPAAPLGGTGPVQVIFDFGGVKAIADREAMWGAILEDTASAAYARDISVETFAYVFDVPAGRPDDQIVEVTVDLESGQKSIRLTSDHLKEDAKLWLPISDIVLKKDNQGYYSYRFTVVRKKSRTDSDLIRDFGTVLRPQVTP